MATSLADFYAGQAMRAEVERSHFLDVQLAQVRQAAAQGKLSRVIDVGAGGGASTANAQAALPGAFFVGLDLSSTAVEWYRKRTAATPLLSSLDHGLPIAESSVDGVICDDVIEHMVDPDQLAREIRRILRPGGHLFLTTPNLAAWFNRALLLLGVQPIFSEVSLERVFGRGGTDIVGHLRLYTRRALCEFLSYHGFEIIRVEGAGFDAVPHWAQPLDRAIARLPGSAAILVCWARKPDDRSPSPSPKAGARTWPKRRGHVTPRPPARGGSNGHQQPVVVEKNPLYDQQTVEVINRVMGPSDVGLDIGANEGAILEAFVARAPEAVHHAFEPIPALADELRGRFPTVQVHQLALSDERGRSQFQHVVTNPSYSGLRRRRYDRPDERVEVIDVEVARLDDVVPEDVPVKVVKIDVEGGELGVLRGGYRILARWRPWILFEHGLGAADFYGTRPETVYDMLVEGIGTRIFLLDGWLAGMPALKRSEFVDEFESNRNWFFLAAPE